MLPHARRVEERCWHVLEAIVGAPLLESQRGQVELPTCMAGLQMPMPTSMVPLARAASIVETGPCVRASVARWGYTAQEAKALDGADDAVADGLLEALLGHGISLGPCGTPIAEPLPHVQDAQALRPPVPQRHLLGTLLRTIAQRL